MSSPQMDDFLQKVVSKVKFKGAHSMIRKELTNHMRELAISYEKRNFAKEKAEEKAISDMGNPFIIGENLNKLHRPRMDWLLITLFVIIAGVSFLPLVGGVPSWEIPGSYFMKRQLIWLTLGSIVILGFLFFDYRKLKTLWMYFYGGGLLLLITTTYFGEPVGGIQRWLEIGPFRIDASTTALFLLYLAWAGIFSNLNQFSSWKRQILLFLLFWAPIYFLAIMPQTMHVIMYFISSLTMFGFSGTTKRFAFKLIIPNIVFGLIMLLFMIYYIFSWQHNRDRFLAFMNPDAYAQKGGYFYFQIRNLLSEAGWFGNGILNVNMEILPEAHTDFAFVSIVSWLGWLFGISICIVLLLFISRISRNAFKSKDRYGRLIVIGGAALLTVPTLWNILMILGILPIMGVSLPFISYGGNMLLFHSAILGLILNVYRRKDIVEPTITHSIKV